MSKFLCYQIPDHLTPVETDAPTPEGAAVMASAQTKTPGRWVIVPADDGPRDFTTIEQRTYSLAQDEPPF